MTLSPVARLGSLTQQRWGMVTTSQAKTVGVTRKQLTHMASRGVIERVAYGVYRLSGAPAHPHEHIYAMWLALSGATTPRTESGVSPLVAAGTTAAVVHEIGDFLLDDVDFIVPARKTTRLTGVRLRTRQLTPDEVIPVNGLPALTVEQTLADLFDMGLDISLINDALGDAVRLGKLTYPMRLRDALAALPQQRVNDTGYVTDELDRLLNFYGQTRA